MTDWMKAGNTAVVTGAAGGIGLEAARRYAAGGMNVVIADVKDELGDVADELAGIAGSPDKVLAKSCDVSKLEEVEALRDAAIAQFGKVHCLMNNAGIGRMGSLPWEDVEQLHTILGINLMGVVHGCHAFIPSMIEHGEAGAVINTGSKQGITRPPGNYAYNISKASVLAYTESIAHAFRGLENCSLKAHLLIPAFVYTPMVSAFIPQKPPFAATAEETVSFMLDALKKDDFYILCPDNETPRELDEKRMQWTADDMIKNRPALSRWHPDFADEFERFVKG
ncbi:MAG: SDR family NAD(P)-dependent oxidoreductase [Pseudomonadota bacterium]